jgi:ABC-type branched-subunit amino acid transport system ATPase component
LTASEKLERFVVESAAGQPHDAAHPSGKTTTLKAISGLLLTERDQGTKGSVELDGERLDMLLPIVVVKRGVAQVSEGRWVSENLTAEENQIAGAHSCPRGARWHRAGLRQLSRVKGTVLPIDGVSLPRRAADASDRPSIDVGRQRRRKRWLW